MAAAQVLKSEWTKIRSVSSTVWTLSLAAVVTIALGILISLLSRNEWDKLSAGTSSPSTRRSSASRG